MTRTTLIIIFIVYCLWCLLQSMLPSIGGDSCSEIMYASKWYLLNGGVQYNPLFGCLQFHEMLLMGLMWLNPTPGSTLPTIMMVLSALVLWNMAESYWPDADGVSGPLAGLLYLSIPISRICSFFHQTEHTMVFFVLLGLNAVIRYRTTDKRWWLVVAGLSIGCSCAVDVNGLIPALIIVVLAGRYWWIVLGCGMVAVAPWYGFNAVWYGNPLFPFREDWFGWMNWGIHEADSASYGKELLIVQRSAVTTPHQHEFSLLVWLFAPLFLWMKRDRVWWVLVWFVVGLAVYWTLYEQIIHARFWLPMLAVLCLMGGVGVANLTNDR